MLSLSHQPPLQLEFRIHAYHFKLWLIRGPLICQDGGNGVLTEENILFLVEHGVSVNAFKPSPFLNVTGPGQPFTWIKGDNDLGNGTKMLCSKQLSMFLLPLLYSPSIHQPFSVLSIIFPLTFYLLLYFFLLQNATLNAHTTYFLTSSLLSHCPRRRPLVPLSTPHHHHSFEPLSFL